MTRSRGGRWALSGARTAVGVAVAAASVVGVVAAVAAPWPVVEREPVGIVVAPAAADSLAVCDGALLAAGRTSDEAGRISAAAATQPVAAAQDTAVDDIVLRSPDVEGSDGSPAFSAPPLDDVATPIAAAASVSIVSDDVSGFAADACRPPLFESWLVGGSTTTGSSALVLISNPGDVASTVDVTVFGATGAAVPPGGSGLSIAPRTQRVIPLAGLALGEESPVLRVSATGAPVRASLQSTLVRTLVPGGVDQQSAVAVPTQTQIIPGVVVTAPPGEAGASDDATVLRLLAPNAAAEATVTVTPTGSSTPALAPSTVPLEAGVPTELGLGGLAVGSYVVTVTAPAAVLAAAWQATGFGAGSDFAWFTSAPALDGATLTAVPAGPAPTLRLANAGDADATVSLRAVRGSGADRSIVVPAGGSAAIALTTASVWAVDPGASDGVHALVAFSAPNAIAGFAVWPPDTAAGAVRVYP